MKYWWYENILRISRMITDRNYNKIHELLDDELNELEQNVSLILEVVNNEKTRRKSEVKKVEN
jgi:hypothetical protein